MQIEVEGRLMWRSDVPRVDGFSQKCGLLVMSWLNKDIFENEAERLSLPAGADRRWVARRKSGNVNPNPENRILDRRSAENVNDRLEKASHRWDQVSSFHRYGRLVQSSASASVVCHGKPKIMLGSNNYLGLTDHPKVKEAAIKATEKYGTGAGGVRLLSGTMDLHRELEEKLAAFKGMEACHIFTSGYVANYAAMTALVEKGDVAFNDQVNHASIIDGCRASEGIIRFYKHKDVANLERKLAAYESNRNKIIITDGVFSMDGDIAPLKELHLLAKKYNAILVVDDAHATGVIGPQGRGTAEHCGILGKVDVTIATLSKSLGAVGGAVCGSRALIKTMFHKSRPFIFSSALPPAVAATVIAALDVIRMEPQLIARLHQNSLFLGEGLRKIGYNAIPSPTAIIPIIIGDEVKTYRLATMLDEMGVFVNAVSRPAVPRELSRLRVSVMATHTPVQLLEALSLFEKAGKTLRLI